MRAVLFDLDDTLYPEIEYVKSGFGAVARYLGARVAFDAEVLLDRMLALLQRDGRGKVFDTLLDELGIYMPQRVSLLLYLYRSHRPVIRLYDDAQITLRELRQHGLQIGIITDGMGAVQRRKVAALGLNRLTDIILCTDELGREYWKPSLVPYQVALEYLDVEPAEAAYVGDNPQKDFHGANLLDMMTIQIARQVASPAAQAHGVKGAMLAQVVIAGLQEIMPMIGDKKNAG